MFELCSHFVNDEKLMKTWHGQWSRDTVTLPRPYIHHVQLPLRLSLFQTPCKSYKVLTLLDVTLTVLDLIIPSQNTAVFWVFHIVSSSTILHTLRWRLSFAQNRFIVSLWSSLLLFTCQLNPAKTMYFSGIKHVLIQGIVTMCPFLSVKSVQWSNKHGHIRT